MGLFTATPTAAPPAHSELVTQDTTQVLQRLFTGHIVGQPAMGYRPLLGLVSANTTPTTVTVTITGFSPVTTSSGLVTESGGVPKAPTPAPTPTFSCYYEPRPQASGTTKKPPVGTKCLVVFPGNDPVNRGFVVAFVGWPT